MTYTSITIWGKIGENRVLLSKIQQSYPQDDNIVDLTLAQTVIKNIKSKIQN
jgi:hypothetical protein